MGESQLLQQGSAHSVSGSSMHGWHMHQKHHKALDMFHVTDYGGNCTAVLPICWHLSLMEKWGHTSPGAAALEYLQLLIWVFVNCLVRNIRRWGINRCLLWAVSLLPVFSNIEAKSTGLATRPTGEQILATKCRQLFMSVCLSHASPKQSPGKYVEKQTVDSLLFWERDGNKFKYKTLAFVSAKQPFLN